MARIPWNDAIHTEGGSSHLSKPDMKIPCNYVQKFVSWRFKIKRHKRGRHTKRRQVAESHGSFICRDSHTVLSNSWRTIHSNQLHISSPLPPYLCQLLCFLFSNSLSNWGEMVIDNFLEKEKINIQGVGGKLNLFSRWL